MRSLFKRAVSAVIAAERIEQAISPSTSGPSIVIDNSTTLDPSIVIDNSTTLDPSIIFDNLSTLDPSIVIDNPSTLDLSIVVDNPTTTSPSHVVASSLHAKFQDMFPSPKQTVKPTERKRKCSHAKIITASPHKNELEEMKQKKKQETERKEENKRRRLERDLKKVNLKPKQQSKKQPQPKKPPLTVKQSKTKIKRARNSQQDRGRKSSTTHEDEDATPCAQCKFKFKAPDDPKSNEDWYTFLNAEKTSSTVPVARLMAFWRMLILFASLVWSSSWLIALLIFVAAAWEQLYMGTGAHN